MMPGQSLCFFWSLRCRIPGIPQLPPRLLRVLCPIELDPRVPSEDLLSVLVLTLVPLRAEAGRAYARGVIPIAVPDRPASGLRERIWLLYPHPELYLTYAPPAAVTHHSTTVAAVNAARYF